MGDDDRWFIARVGYVETLRMLLGARLGTQVRAFRADWPRFGVIELDAGLSEEAAKLAAENRLRSLDAIHLAAALSLPTPDLVLTTWDRRLHAAAATRGLAVIPESL
jgi:predicted nucleic acid-binding protein